MAFDGFILYLLARHKRDMLRENYMMDMLWAAGVYCAFHDERGAAQYPRWHEIINPKEEPAKAIITKETVKEQFGRLRNGGG